MVWCMKAASLCTPCRFKWTQVLIANYVLTPIRPSAEEKWFAERLRGVFFPPQITQCFMHNLYSTVTKSHLPLCWPLQPQPVHFSSHRFCSIGWPFQPCLCPRWTPPPPISLKLDCFFPISLDRKWPSCQTGTDMLLQRVDTMWETPY